MPEDIIEAERTRVIAIIGSALWESVIRHKQAELELAGHVVLTRNVSLARLSEHGLSTSHATASKAKEVLDAVSRRKIAMADEVIVVALKREGKPYVDTTTALETSYAKSLGKDITYIS